MNKFETMLNKSVASIRGQRSLIVGKAARKAQEAIVRVLEDRLDKIDEDLLTTTDIYPHSELTLMVTNNSFNATTWAAKLQDLKVQRANTLVELELAQETMTEFFTNTPKTKKATKTLTEIK